MKLSADHVRIAIVAIETMTIQGKDAAAVADALGNFREVHKAMTAPQQAAPVAEPKPKRSHKRKTDLVPEAPAPQPPKTANGAGHTAEQ